MVLHLGMTSQGEHEPESHIRGYTTLDQPWSLNPQIQTRVTLTSNFFEAVLAWPLSEHQAPCEEPSMRQSTWILFRVLGPWDIRRLSGLGCRGFQALHQPKHATAILLNSKGESETEMHFQMRCAEAEQEGLHLDSSAAGRSTLSEPALGMPNQH